MTEFNHVEQSVIAALLVNSELINYCEERGITSESFTAEFLKQAYERMQKQYRENGMFDTMTLAGDDNEALMALTDIQFSVVTFTNFEAWVKILKKEEAKRSILAAMEKTRKALGNQDYDVVQIAEELNLASLQATESVLERKERSLADLAQEAYDNIRNAETESVPWFGAGTEGRSAVRHFKRQMFVLAGESGTGKTEMSLSCAVYPCLQEGKRVLYICTESPASEIFGRLAGCISGVPYNYLTSPQKTREQADSWTEVLQDLRKRYKNYLTILGSESRVNTVPAIRAAVRKNILRYGKVDLLVIDFLQDVRSENPKDTEYERIGKTVNGIKDIADEYGVAVLLNTQLNRTESRQSEKPGLYRLKGSGEIEQKAHIVAFIYRDRKAGKNLFYSCKTRGVRPFDLELEFNRYGYQSRVHKYSVDDEPQGGAK